MGIQRLCHHIASTVVCRVVLATAAIPWLVSRRLGGLGSQFARAVRSCVRVGAGNVLGSASATRGRLVSGCLLFAGIASLGASTTPWVASVSIAAASAWLPVASLAIDGRFRSEGRPRFDGRSRHTTERAVVVGSDGERIERLVGETDHSIVGYVSSSVGPRPGPREIDTERAPTAVRLTDGGSGGRVGGSGGRSSGGVVAATRLDDLRHLGDLSGLPAVLGTYDIDRVLLAFPTPDRRDFFGTLATCRDHGVAATVPDECADSVLIERTGDGAVDVALEPWAHRERLVKGCFDKLFALAALLCAVPLIVLISLAIRLDSSGPILYSQDRTTKFGRTFRLYKFRTMTPGSEDAAPMDDEENTQITRIGRFLRRTHLDEIPQLYSILVGDMSVVGPRATWIEEDAAFIEGLNGRWRKRWFVEPGLTGLAQINDVSSTNPELKLHYDLEYIENHSFPFDVWIVCRQIRLVLGDLFR